MARKKVETEKATEVEKTVPVAKDETQKEDKPKAARTRKKKAEEKTAITAPYPVAEPDSVPKKTQAELDREEFDVPQNGVMRHTLSAYENGEKGFELCTRHIKYLVGKVGKSYLKIGVLLSEVQYFHKEFIEDKYNYVSQTRWIECDKYEVEIGTRRDRFKDIYDYAAYEFGFSRGSVNNFINIARRFSENYISYVDGSVNLKPEYKKYSVSQLIQLLPYTDEQIKKWMDSGKIHPNMSCRFLRQTLKQLAAPALVENKLNPDEHKKDAVIEGQVLKNDDDNLSKEKDELYAACTEFEQECNVAEEKQLVFSYVPEDLLFSHSVFGKDEKQNVIGFNENYEKIFFSRINELLSKGYRIEINAVKKN